jgi:hypothetical protein
MNDILIATIGGICLFVIFFIHFLLTHNSNEKKNNRESTREEIS